jgi:hypothetical protein
MNVIPSRRVSAPLLVAALVLVLGACLPPSQDPFYTTPDPLPAGAPGDVIDAREATFSLDPLNQTPVPGVSSWQVIYHSTDALGDPMALSGTVLVPDSPWLIGDRPVVAYAPGTRGVGDDCAPSFTLSQGTDYEGLFVNGLLDMGWAVAVTDYQGLGTTGPHTYMVGPAQGHALLDMVRAAQRLPEAGLSADAPVGLMGYSQGGSGAGWAAQSAADYAPELSVRGSVVGGTPADLGRTAEYLDGSAFVAFALLASLGLDAAYPELDLDSYLNAKGQRLVEEAGDVCLVDVDGFATFLETAFTSIDDYVTTNPLDTPAWQARLDENLLGDTAPSAPVFQYHGAVDQIIPDDQARQLRKDWCQGGGTVTWTSLPAEHLTGLVEGYPLGVTWLANRFAGVHTWGNCPFWW